MAQAGAAPIDRYVVVEHLSEGGMGTIYLGRKLGAGGFEMEVVLKQLLPEFTEQEEFIDLFLREARLSATLHHANIIHTIDLVTTGGEYFIVMEYLPGADLRTLLRRAKRRGKRISPTAAIYICREVLSALAYAHNKRDNDGNPMGLIHRDVSPANVLLSPAGEVKLTDFGIAKATKHTSQLYKVKGKVGYMSPEQARSEPLDQRSDLYSLAVCAYEILTGERLFIHAGLTTSADQIYSQAIPKLSSKVPGLPVEFDSIITSALAIDPNLRFQTAGEFQEALMRCAHRNGLLMSAPGLAAELRDTCGLPELWRDFGEDDDSNRAERGGTEIYDAGEDEDPSSVARPPRAGALKSELDRFHGKELTSIIRAADDVYNGYDARTMGNASQAAGNSSRGSTEDGLQNWLRHEVEAARPVVNANLGRASQVGPAVSPLPDALPVPVPPTAELPVEPSSEPEPPLIPAWILVAAIVLIAGVIAAAVAFSGPTVGK